MDPRSFVCDCFIWREGECAAPYQLNILDKLVEHKKVAVRGPHGIGKTAIAAWAILWFAITRDGDDWKNPTTASAWRQLTHYLWPEIRKWARRIDWSKVNRSPFDPHSEQLSLSLKLRTGEAFAVASDQPELVEGAHADYLFYVFDESKSIRDETFDAAEGAFSGGEINNQEAYALAISTPGARAGRFHDIHNKKAGYEDWHCIHVTLEEAIAANRISRKWAVQRERQWGAGSAIFANRVLGNFADSESDSVIPLSWVEAAVERWYALQDDPAWASDDPTRLKADTLTAVGADIARSGGDDTALALRAGWVITDIRTSHYADTMIPVGLIGGILQRYGGWGLIDIIGIGAGVYDRLRELQHHVLPFVASAGCDAKDRSGELGFLNLRAAAWWRVRELLDPSSTRPMIALPDHSLMIGDLTTPTWKVNSTGRIQIESKESIHAKLGRSTDTGDAVIQAFALELVRPDQTEQDVWGGSIGQDERTSVEEAIAQTGIYWPEPAVEGSLS